jgi:putative ABC transport system permease protein
VLVGIGAVLFVSGVIVAGSFIAVGSARITRPLLQRVGLEGRLAVDNTIRSPKRTATTANALLIGVFVVTLVAVSGTSVRDFDDALHVFQVGDERLVQGAAVTGDQVVRVPLLAIKRLCGATGSPSFPVLS